MRCPRGNYCGGFGLFAPLNGTTFDMSGGGAGSAFRSKRFSKASYRRTTLGVIVACPSFLRIRDTRPSLERGCSHPLYCARLKATTLRMLRAAAFRLHASVDPEGGWNAV
jgi:hypothetical protein